MRKIVFALITVTAIMACTSIDCPVQNLVYTNYELKKAGGKADTLNTDSIWIWTHRANGTDTIVLNALCGSSATKFSLPISHTQPEDVFYMLLTDTARNAYIDTIRIKKEDYPHFESVDCQASYFHTITAVSTTHNTLDSIVINHPEVNYDVSQTHFHIYFKARR